MSNEFGVPEPESLTAMNEAPIAESSVRLALPAEANRIGEIQVAAWRQSYQGLLPDDVLLDLNPAQFAAQWRAALISPGEARNRVMVALAGRDLVGFAAITPSDDPDANPKHDALIAELAIDPAATRSGHGSRLLHAVVDTIRADGFTRLTLWVNSTDDILRAFLTEAGWGPDGAHRELDLYGDESIRIKQIRMHTDPGTTD
ncbi:acetyltransferase (GNAT) family protein [Kribbella amoyensis]|uniref:Acetyltransferase (GNAT) family protein n=1 Tax=Kribbella amoyensis TaxID=996641 RepID=A0A561BXF6_9ACTN|nr:GNAT family N-acetyltransferase [Kribbella amoyensis]TWD83570.1 acetyltransferase (GNAT) family protein [Kribbella amoyensis]